MAGTNERFPLPERAWFDASNPGQLHDALRVDYARTRAQVLQRPSLRRHMEDCSVCQAIGGATAAAPPPSATRQRLKVVLTKSRMHQVLGLPESFEIVHMWADNDPNVITVLLAGEGLPVSHPDDETPTGRLDDVRDDDGDIDHDLFAS